MLFHTGNMFKEIINMEVPVHVFQVNTLIVFTNKHSPFHVAIYEMSVTIQLNIILKNEELTESEKPS